MKRIRHKTLAGLALVPLLATAPPAWAYLDPSTGSMILSAIVGLFATMALAAKTYWYKLKSLLRRDSNGVRRNEQRPNDKQSPTGTDPAAD